MLVKTAHRFENRDWASATTECRTKIYKLHQFLVIISGKVFNIEIQEDTTGKCEAHADNTTDPHDAIKSCHGGNVTECLNTMIKALEMRIPGGT